MRLVLETPKGKIYRLTDPEANVTPDEWSRVVFLIEWAIDLANQEGVDVTEMLMCLNNSI